MRLIILFLLASGSAAAASEPSQVLFDDFSYTSIEPFRAHGWTDRTAKGWPGIEGASWNGMVGFVDDPANKGNRLVRMTAMTDGAATSQAQFCHQRKYREGTYAARVRFSNGPISGPDGDQVVETFYTIAPLKAPLDPDYSEQDFEYLPNGGWGGADLTLHNTTWETFRPEPDWLQVSKSDSRRGSLEGWRTLVLQIANHEVRYFLDGALLATHGEPYYPEDHMSINFNLWFIREGLIGSRERRIYTEDVDWVFHAAGSVLSPAEVEKQVTALRAAKVAFRDTVPALQPPLSSPCDL
ncbi:MAG TPA: glycoside hydrolase family 16 protein [Steroidobacteraceae bacterium]|nr:glycoside hydrolase family 16 protein [Steroidobacteraceae bacterium]